MQKNNFIEFSMPFLCKICGANVGNKLSTNCEQPSAAAVPCASADEPTATGRCSFCFGLLDDDELLEKIVDEAVRQLRREGHDAVNFVLALNMPMSVLLREAVFERLVEPAWAPMSMSPKELLSRHLMPKISKATGLRPSLNSDLTLTVTLENDEFVQSDFDFLVLNFPDEFMRSFAPKRRRRNRAGNVAAPPADMASSLLTKVKVKSVRDQMGRAVASNFKLSAPSRPCTCASVTLERQPLYIGGRYCKYSRFLPQSPWIGAGVNGDEEAEAYGAATPATGDGAATVDGMATEKGEATSATGDGAATVDGMATEKGDATSATGDGAATADGMATEKDAATLATGNGAAIPTGPVRTEISENGDAAAVSPIADDGPLTLTTTAARMCTVPTAAARRLFPQSSVSEKIAGALMRHFGADGSRFIASGREDIDVRMLGTGRPFAVQLLNARKTACLRTRASAATALAALADQINGAERARDIRVHSLAHVSAKQTQQLNVGQEEKRKTYSALCCARTPLVDDAPLRALHAHTFPLRVAQRTAVRVLKRRPLIDRTRCVYAMRALPLDPHHFVLRLETQAGTYVKEFVHSDFGRTRPSVAELMGLELGQVDIVRLDVLNVDLTWPPVEAKTDEKESKKTTDNK